MSVRANWSSPLLEDMLLDLRRLLDIRDVAQDGDTGVGMNRESDAKVGLGLFTIVLPTSGAVIRPRVATSVVFLLSCVAVGGGVTSIFVHFGKTLTMGNFPAVLLALVTVLAMYFGTSRLFVRLMTWSILRLPKRVCQLFFEGWLLAT